MAMSYEETKAQNNKANLADAQRKGLADASGNYKQDELGRTYNTDTAKWEAGPTTSVARAGYTNESSGGGSGGGNALS